MQSFVLIKHCFVVAHVLLAVSANKLINKQRSVNNYEIYVINGLQKLSVLFPSPTFSIRKSLVSAGYKDIKDVKTVSI